jgi:hypothetical protein
VKFGAKCREKMGGLMVEVGNETEEEKDEEEEEDLGT